MGKTTNLAVATVAASLLLLGSSLAQQSTTSTTKPASATTTKSSTAAKPSAATKPATPASSKPLTLTTEKDKLSYAIGMNIGEGMKKDALDINPEILARAIKDAMAGNKLLMTDEQAKVTLNTFRAEMMKKQQEEAQKAANANKEAGLKFLAENKTKPGVVALPSGLQYKVIKQGDGPKPTTTDTVVANYSGTLIDGKEFDSSYKRGEPITIPVTGVIKGWTEALQLMPVGSKWQLFIPSDLAYGERSPGAEIGPNSTLVFDIELMSIQPKDDKKDAPTPQ